MIIPKCSYFLIFIAGVAFRCESMADVRTDLPPKLKREFTAAAVFEFKNESWILVEFLGKEVGLKKGDTLSEWRGRLFKGGEGNTIVVIVGESEDDNENLPWDHGFQITQATRVKGDWIITGKMSSDRLVMVEFGGEVFKFRVDDLRHP